MTRNVSIYNGVKDTKGVVVSVDSVLKRISEGKRGLDEKTRLLRVLRLTDKAAYNSEKEKLPCVTWSGSFSSRVAANLITHSGLIVLDFDDQDVGGLLADLSLDPHVFFAFVSPSGVGVKCIVPVSPVPTSAAEHKHAFATVKSHFEQYALVDPSGSDVSRLCFLAHDRQAIYNQDAMPIAWELPEPEQASDGEGWAGGSRAMPAVDDTEAAKVLSFLDPDCDYETWLHIGMGCHAGGVPFAVWDAWSAKGTKYKAAEIPAKWESFKGSGITWGTVVHLAKQNGYKPPRSENRRRVKLQKNIVSVLTETIDKSREFLKSVFENKKIKFFGLRADTGVGKNEAAISFFLRGFSGLINVPTTDLAKELHARFDKAEIDSFRYRGILSNPDGAFPDETPCIHAVRYDAIASRGWNAYQLLCEHCEVRSVCEDRGYRSQARQAKEAQVTVMPFPDIFLNPAFRTLAKDFLPVYSEDLILHDEFDPYNAFLEINVPKFRLVQLRDDWKGDDPSAFAKEILQILEVEGDLSELRSLVMGLTASEREAVVQGLTSVMWCGQVLSREDAHRCNFFRAKAHNTEQILTLPRLETEDWNLLVQLELFFERYGRDADMPMKYENDTLTFLLPPLPMKTRARMGFMSATLDETLFRQCFDTRADVRGDVTFHDIGLTEWHPDARVYQLRTNRNPRATVYASKTAAGEASEGVGGWHGFPMPADSQRLLSQTGEFYWELIQEDLKKQKRGVISYKALLAEKASELDGIPMANFGGLVGLDTDFKDVDVLHVLFGPELPPCVVEFKAKALFGDGNKEALIFQREADGQYIDKRLQQCYADGVISELQQAIGRGRLVSRPVTVVVWCSHHLPGITDRDKTCLFDEVEWQQAEGDLENLREIIAMRETGDVQAYALVTRVSESTAYRQTAEKRKQTKAERDAEINRRHAVGETQQQIADVLDVGIATVNRVLKK